MASLLFSSHSGTTKLSSCAQPKRAHRNKSSELEELCKRFELSNDDIDKEVSGDHILEIYSQLENWKEVAAHLGLTQEDVEAIEGRAGLNEKLMKLYMLQEWKRKNKIKGAATYRVLLEALLKCDCANTVVKVCELLSSS